MQQPRIHAANYPRYLSRRLAIDALGHVLQRRQHADVALDQLCLQHQLSALDRSLAHELVYGALRHLSWLDWKLAALVDRPFSSLDPRIVNCLRIGAYQLYHTRIPARAAVSETVEAAKNIGISRATSFINAILRRISRNEDAAVLPEDFSEQIAIQNSVPFWLVQRWGQRVPQAELESHLKSINLRPEATIHVMKDCDKLELFAYLKERFGILATETALPGCVHLDRYPTFSACEWFQKGRYFVQDEAAQLVTLLLAFENSHEILDACAAPGGKSLLLWDRGVAAQNLYVCDASQKRLQVLQQNFLRHGLKVENILCGDISKTLPNKNFDRILLDAPCSALGVLRRHPEIRWHRNLTDINRCATEQATLLAALANRLTPGGELVYVVCSTEPEEGTLQICDFLKKNANFTQVNLQGKIPDSYHRYLTSSLELVIPLNNQHNMDGFYATVLKKIGA